MSAAAKGRFTIDDTKPIWRTMLVFLVPLMLSNVLQSLGQSANAVYLGRLVGVRSLAAVSAIFPLVFFLISALIGLASASSVLIGQAFGARDPVRVKQIAGTSLALALGLGTVLGAIGMVFSRDILVLLATPSDILETSASYARFAFASLPLLFVYLVYTTFLRGVGDTRTPFFVLIVSTALTFAITPIFILGSFGTPKFGTNGAALGNIVSTALALVGLLVYLGIKKDPLALDAALLRNFRIRGDIARAIAKIGIPTSINLTMVSLSEIALLSLVNRYGSNALAAYGAVNQVVSYVQFPAISIGIASSIFGAQSIGAARTDRLGAIVRSATALNYAIEGILIVVVYIFASAIIGLFVKSPETEAIARHLLAITLWSYAIFGNARVLSAIMISTGTVLWPTAISILSIWLVEVPVAVVTSHRIGLDGVWYGYPAAFVAGLAGQAIYYHLIWKKKTHVRLV